MKTWSKVLLGIFAVLIIAIALVYFSLTSSKTISAQLYIEQGKVLVNGNSVSSDILLDEKDVIETSSDGKATIILYESLVVSLDSNTKITLSELSKKHPQLVQEGGSTWSKFTKLLGVEDYTISAGTSVASVRGTEFGLTENKVLVSEGEVNYDFLGQNYSVTENEIVENGQEREMTEEEKQLARQNSLRIIQQLKKLRQAEISKHPRVLQMIKSKFELSDQDIQQALEDADNGELNIDEVRTKSPVKLDSIDKIADLTMKIRELQNKLK